MKTHTCTLIHTHTQACKHMHAHTHTQTHTHTHTHTHTQIIFPPMLALSSVLVPRRKMESMTGRDAHARDSTTLSTTMFNRCVGHWSAYATWHSSHPATGNLQLCLTLVWQSLHPAKSNLRLCSTLVWHSSHPTKSNLQLCSGLTFFTPCNK